MRCGTAQSSPADPGPGVEDRRLFGARSQIAAGGGADADAVGEIGGGRARIEAGQQTHRDMGRVGGGGQVPVRGVPLEVGGDETPAPLRCERREAGAVALSGEQFEGRKLRRPHRRRIGRSVAHLVGREIRMRQLGHRLEPVEPADEIAERLPDTVPSDLRGKHRFGDRLQQR